MANKKISELTALGATPATDDVAVLVDTDADETKKVSVSDLMGAAPVQSVGGATGVVTLAAAGAAPLASPVFAANIELEGSSGDLIFEMDNNAANSANFQIQNGAGNARADLVLDSNLHITMKGQRVGILDPSPDYTLDVNGDGRFVSDLTITGSSGDLIFEMDNNAANSANFRIQNGAGNARADLVLDSNTIVTMKGQRVGILDTTPDYTLDVNGDGRFTSDLTVGGTLTASGFSGGLQIGTTSTTALAGNTPLLALGTTSSTALAGNTSLLALGTTSSTALAGNTSLLALGTTSSTALAGNTALLALGTTSSTALAGDSLDMTVLTDATGTRTPALTDNRAYIVCTHGSAMVVTLPKNATVAFPVGANIVFERNGAGTLTFAAESGATVNSKGGTLTCADQYTTVAAVKIATDTWTIFGNIG